MGCLTAFPPPGPNTFAANSGFSYRKMQWHGGVGFRALAGGLGAVGVLLRLDVVLGGLAEGKGRRGFARDVLGKREKKREEKPSPTTKAPSNVDSEIGGEKGPASPRCASP